MRILYYIPNLSQKDGGIRQYSVALLKILSADTANQYFILHNNDDPEILDILKDNAHLFLIPKHVGIENRWDKIKSNAIKLYNFVGSRRKKAYAPHNWSYVERICQKYTIDIVHSPFQFAPYCRKKIIWTLHDVQELHFPEYFSPEERAFRATKWVSNIKRGAHIVVSYNHVKADIRKYFNISDQKISVCLLDMQNLWLDKYTENDINPSFLSSLPPKFLFYPANTWKHKNHIGLIESLKILNQRGYNDIIVLCSGHKNKNYEDNIKPLIEEYNLKTQIQFLGILPEQELYSLYKTTRGVVVPTKYEAGSFPLMESLLLNCPVICSNVTSLPETIGDNSFVFDPDNYYQLADMLLELWTNDDFRNRNIKNTFLQKDKLKYNNALSIIHKIYNHV